MIEKSEIQALLQMEGQDDAALTETGFIRTLERSCGFSLSFPLPLPLPLSFARTFRALNVLTRNAS